MAKVNYDCPTCSGNLIAQIETTIFAMSDEDYVYCSEKCLRAGIVAARLGVDGHGGDWARRSVQQRKAMR